MVRDIVTTFITIRFHWCYWNPINYLVLRWCFWNSTKYKFCDSSRNWSFKTALLGPNKCVTNHIQNFSKKDYLYPVHQYINFQFFLLIYCEINISNSNVDPTWKSVLRRIFTQGWTTTHQQNYSAVHIRSYILCVINFNLYSNDIG